MQIVPSRSHAWQGCCLTREAEERAQLQWLLHAFDVAGCPQELLKQIKLPYYYYFLLLHIHLARSMHCWSGAGSGLCEQKPLSAHARADMLMPQLIAHSFSVSQTASAILHWHCTCSQGALQLIVLSGVAMLIGCSVAKLGCCLTPASHCSVFCQAVGNHPSQSCQLQAQAC